MQIRKEGKRMSFEVFCKHVRSYMRTAEVKTAEFFRENGKHIACLPGGVTITGNSVSPRLCVEWGSGHKAFVMA